MNSGKASGKLQSAYSGIYPSLDSHYFLKVRRMVLWPLYPVEPAQPCPLLGKACIRLKGQDIASLFPQALGLVPFYPFDA